MTDSAARAVPPEEAPPSTTEELQDSLARIDHDVLAAKATAIVQVMCEGNRWRMSIPPRPDDADMVLSELIRRFQLRALGAFAARSPHPDTLSLSTLREAVRRYLAAKEAYAGAWSEPICIAEYKQATAALRALVEDGR